MKKVMIRLSMICLLLVGIISTSITAGERVIYEFKQITANQGEIILDYYEPTLLNDIRVVSYYEVDSSTIEVSYTLGSKIAESNRMKITLPDGTFPKKILLKEQKNNVPKLNDLPSDNQMKNDILFLFDQGILSGYPDGSFKPNRTVTRAEFAKMMVYATGFERLINKDSIFKDVSNDFWGKAEIMTLADKGILVGRGRSLFDPNATITMGEVLTVISRTFAFYPEEPKVLNESVSHWSKEFYTSLYGSSIVIDTDTYVTPYRPDEKATRQQCATLLSRVLINPTHFVNTENE